jgi:hypothetical protein
MHASCLHSSLFFQIEKIENENWRMENKYLNFGDWGMRKEEVTPPFSPH